MPAAAPRTTKPTTSAARKSTRASAIAATARTKVPPLSIVKAPPGPAIKFGSAPAAKDPRFNKVIEKLEKNSAKAKEHTSPARKAAEAQAAAQPPGNEKLAFAQADKVDAMQDAETKKPEPASFLTLLRAEIEKAMPKTLGATENFMKGDDKAKLKGAATSNVNQQKEEATSGIKSVAGQAPDTSQVQGKEVAKLPSEGASLQPPAIGAADAISASKPNEEVSLQKGKDEANKSLAAANVTPEQLRKANDPRFSAVLTSKSAVEKQADTAPQKFRSEEQKTITQAAAKAVGDEKKGLMGLHGTQGKAAASVKARQLAAKAQDEARRKAVADYIQQIYNETKQAVDTKLNGLEKEVSDMFDKGIESALKSMTDYIEGRMSRWKTIRYFAIPGGFVLWIKDKLVGLPDEVKLFYEEGRKNFVQNLDAVIVNIAKLVDTRLKEAKDMIANGQRRISDYVNGLPKDLQAVGKAAEKEMVSRFDELRQGVDDKKNELAQNLAQRYKEANDKANEKLKEMQAENRGLVSILKEKLGEVIKILTEFKNRIMGMIKQGKAAIDLIVADPIGFLKNLLKAVKQGLFQFVSNIWEHLKAGFMGWLFGSLAEMGIEMPKDFSLGSILKLVLSVLGLTYARIRAKAVKLVGERTVKILETAADFVVTFITGGAAALWEKIKEYLSDLKEMLLSAVQEWVVTSIIKAAITKLVSMFNPVGAIVQAIITIYNTVMFLIERINQILDFVEAVVSSIYKIATGDVGSAANWIEKALARTIPLIIAFLARLLGLSGIAGKIKSFILKIQDKVDKAIDKVIQKIVSGIGKLLGKGAVDSKDVGSAQVKQMVQEELVRTMRGKKFEREEQIEETINNIFNKMKPKGLKALRIHADPNDVKGKITILASASEEDSVFVTSLIELIPEISTEAKGKLGIAGRKSYAILSVNGSPRGSIEESGEEDIDGTVHTHAEAKLVERPEWRKEIEAAAARALDEEPKETIIVIAINRTPCHSICTLSLKAAHGEFVKNIGGMSDRRKNKSGSKVSWVVSKVRFVLTALGWYRGKAGPTEPSDISSLMTAGWEVKVFEKPDGGQLTKRGEKLAELIADVRKVRSIISLFRALRQLQAGKAKKK